MEKPQILCKKMEEHKWKEEEEWRTLERKKKREKNLILKLVQQVTNSVFYKMN